MVLGDNEVLSYIELVPCAVVTAGNESNKGIMTYGSHVR